jgi:hypothetical protein
MQFIEVYRGYQIYVIPDAYLSLPQNKLLSRYIAVYIKGIVGVDDVSLPSLKATIDEMLRSHQLINPPKNNRVVEHS